MPKKILLVDDEADIVSSIKARLEANNYEVIVAVDGQQALEMARKEIPDLIILDLMLPKIDGYRVCRLLKFDDKYKHIPIFMFTARAQESDKKLGEEVGADAYILKPFELKSLMDKIKNTLETFEKGK
jgi:two-component system, OmpR family, alkaline phosphatase synthesis response regulator PhoP